MNNTLYPPVIQASLPNQSLLVFRANLGAFTLLSLIIYAAILLLGAISVFWIAPSPDTYPINLLALWNNLGVLRKLLIFLLLVIAAPLLVSRGFAAAIIVVKEAQAGNRCGAFRALGMVRWKSLRLFWLAWVLSFIPPFFQGIFVGLILSPTFPIAVIEELGVRQAFARSGKLNKNAWGRIVLLFLIYNFLILAITVFAFVILNPILSGVTSAVAAGIWIILILLTGMWYMTALTLNYFDRRRLYEEPTTSHINPEFDAAKVNP